MSGLWLLLVLGVWGGLTWFFLKAGRKFIEAGAMFQRTRIGIAAIGALLWLGISFWYGGGRKVYYDAEVNRLCRVDGGVKVYETVKLPAEKYDAFARSNWIFPDKSRAKPADDYYIETERHYFKTGNPEVRRSHDKIIRRSDGKILGEFVYYARRGGDMPGPWHESAFGCPDPQTLPNFENSIFSRE